MDCDPNIFERADEGYIRDEDFPSPFDNIKSYLSDTFLSGNDDPSLLDFSTIPADDDMMQSQVALTNNNEPIPTDKSLNQSLNPPSNPHQIDLQVNPSPLAQNLNPNPNLHDPNSVPKSSTKNRILLPDGLEIGPYGLTVINSMSFSNPQNEINNSLLGTQITPSNSILSTNKQDQIIIPSFPTSTINLHNQLPNQSSNVVNPPYHGFATGSGSSFYNVSSSMQITLSNTPLNHRSSLDYHNPLKLMLTPKPSCSIPNYNQLKILGNQQFTLQASSSRAPQHGKDLLWKQPSMPQSSVSTNLQQGMHATWPRPSTSQQPLMNLVDSRRVAEFKRRMTPEMLEEVEKEGSKRFRRYG